jgi:hypothetical protein
MIHMLIKAMQWNLNMNKVIEWLTYRWNQILSPTPISRGGNRAGRVGFGFGLDGSGQFDFLEEIELGRTGSGRVNLYVVFFQIVDRFRLD